MQDISTTYNCALIFFAYFCIFFFTLYFDFDFCFSFCVSAWNAGQMIWSRCCAQLNMHFIYTSSLNITVKVSSTRDYDFLTFRYAILNGSIDSGKEPCTSFNGVLALSTPGIFVLFLFLCSCPHFHLP